MCVNNLPKVVTWQYTGLELNQTGDHSVTTHQFDTLLIHHQATHCNIVMQCKAAKICCLKYIQLNSNVVGNPNVKLTEERINNNKCILHILVLAVVHSCYTQYF